MPAPASALAHRSVVVVTGQERPATHAAMRANLLAHGASAVTVHGVRDFQGDGVAAVADPTTVVLLDRSFASDTAAEAVARWAGAAGCLFYDGAFGAATIAAVAERTVRAQLDAYATTQRAAA